MFVTWQSLVDFSWVSDSGAWIGLITLVALEIVLGIDNIVFISILSAKLPAEEQPKARKTGLVLAVLPRILLLLFLPFVLSLEKPLFTLPFPDPGHPEHQLGISGQDLIVLIGGVFLLWKATNEIHHKLEGEEEQPTSSMDATGEGGSRKGKPTFGGVMVQIMLLNIVFSLDSIITAIGMVPKEQVTVMVLAVLISTAVMALTVNIVSAFVEKHPTVKMLALSFLLLIGFTLVVEGIHFHIPKGYVYFAMGFSVAVETLNLLAKRGKSAPVHLRGPHLPQHAAPVGTTSTGSASDA
ncbi:MAG: TerC family protein [Armatimonadaceae bacterium]